MVGIAFVLTRELIGRHCIKDTVPLRIFLNVLPTLITVTERLLRNYGHSSFPPSEFFQTKLVIEIYSHSFDNLSGVHIFPFSFTGVALVKTVGSKHV